MLYLSRLILNPRSRQVRSELQNPYEMHRTLLQAVDRPRQKAGLLFRVDIERDTGIPIVLVQTQLKPDWGFLQQKPGYLLDTAEANPACKAFSLSAPKGCLLQFRLRANPTKRRPDNAKRVGLYREEEQRQWLERKLEKAGCRLVMCQIIKEDIIKLCKKANPESTEMPLLSVRFEGILQVLDPDLLQQAVAQGLGSAKAFGFGLLSLAPAW